MLQRRRRKKGKALYSQKNIEQDTYSSTHPSTTFINNLLHSKSTYFYNGWGRVIPTFCMLALLVGLHIILNPITNRGANQAYAESGTMDDDWYKPCTPIPPVASRDNSNISLTITPETIDSVDAKVGETAYSNHTVCINGSSIKSYSMSISYDNDSTSLSHSENSSISVGNVDNSGVVGDNLVANTWGWGWSDNISADSNTMTYKPLLTGDGSIVKSAAAGTISNNTVNTGGKLAFAVKFSEDMQAGHYTTNVKLALVMEPAEVTVIEYKLVYDANGVYTDKPESTLATVPSTQTYTDTSASTSHTFMVSSSTLSGGWKGGCSQSFKGWSTSKNGSIEYSPGSQITLQSNNPMVTLYAIWRQGVCTA